MNSHPIIIAAGTTLAEFVRTLVIFHHESTATQMIYPQMVTSIFFADLMVEMAKVETRN